MDKVSSSWQCSATGVKSRGKEVRCDAEQVKPLFRPGRLTGNLACRLQIAAPPPPHTHFVSLSDPLPRVVGKMKEYRPQTRVISTLPSAVGESTNHVLVTRSQHHSVHEIRAEKSTMCWDQAQPTRQMFVRQALCGRWSSSCCACSPWESPFSKTTKMKQQSTCNTLWG